MSKTSRIVVRITDDEMKDLHDKANALGYENYSDFIRALVWDFGTVDYKIRTSKTSELFNRRW